MTRPFYASIVAALSLATLSVTALNGQVYGWSETGMARGAAMVVVLEDRRETPVVADSANHPASDPITERAPEGAPPAPIPDTEPAPMPDAPAPAEPPATSKPGPDASDADAPKRPSSDGEKVHPNAVATR